MFPPKRNEGQNFNRNPWLSIALLKSIKKKSRLYKQYLRRPTLDHEDKYKKYKNKLNHLIRIAKWLYYEKQLFKNKTYIKSTWKILNEIINKRSNSTISTTAFHCDDNKITEPILRLPTDFVIILVTLE